MPSMRIVTPEQYKAGYWEWRAGLIERKPYMLILKREDGNYLVREPTPKRTLRERLQAEDF